MLRCKSRQLRQGQQRLDADSLRAWCDVQHKIEVSSCRPYRNYWFVRIACCDRLKLLFDLVCTFVDLDYDVFHASLDTDAGNSIVEFYIRPRLGSSEFDEAKGQRLAQMLKHAIFRRVPKGVPIRMVTPGPGLRQHVRLSFDV